MSAVPIGQSMVGVALPQTPNPPSAPFKREGMGHASVLEVSRPALSLASPTSSNIPRAANQPPAVRFGFDFDLGGDDFGGDHFGGSHDTHSLGLDLGDAALVAATLEEPLEKSRQTTASRRPKNRSSAQGEAQDAAKDGWMNRLAQGMIKTYQFITRKVPGVSHVWRFFVRCAYVNDPQHKGEYQSCSEYGMSCFKELPFHRAFIQTAKRLLTCSPLYFLKETPGFRWAQGWVDDVKTIDATKKNLGLNQVA